MIRGADCVMERLSASSIEQKDLMMWVDIEMDEEWHEHTIALSSGGQGNI